MLRAGHCSEYVGDGGVGCALIAEQLSNAVEDFLEGIHPMMFGNALPSEWYYSQHWDSILTATASSNHGGAYFVVSDHDADDGSWRNLVRIKYPCELTFWADLRNEILATFAPEKVANNVPIVPRSNWFRRIASLSNVDGAVLMTDHFRLLGFGVEALPHGDVRHLRLRGQIVDIEKYGTRHRSAARFCASYPGSLAFVCSQDGGTMCMRFIDGEVRAWR
jgi:hypothetical protein